MCALPISLSEPFGRMRLDCGRALLEMVLPNHQELSFEEVCQTVEKESSKLKLEMDAHGEGPQCKGRYLVASCALKAGDVILSELPLFEGNTDAKKSEKVYSDAFLEKLHAKEEQQDDFEEDCFHPRSPLMDCVAAVLLCKLEVLDKEGKDSWDLAALNMRKFCALCRSPVQSTTDHKECVEDLWGALKPELQKVTSLEELSHIIQILSSNRFGHGGNSMQLMFAGSMFEHSCLPNCFLGTWATSDHAPQTYRALRDIEKGEALSIDYLNFPLGYCPVSARAQSFQNWGFTCSCLRCTELPEVERSFYCPDCGEPDLCPRKPGSSELQCLSCKKVAEADYAARCFEKEAQLQPEPGSPATETLRKIQGETDEENLLGHRHHLVVQALWQDVEEGLPDSAELPAFQQMLEALIESISSVGRLELHPSMLNFYHLAALSTQEDLEAQKHYLQLEHRILQRFYPDEAQRQEDEIMALVKCNAPPTKDGLGQMD